MVLRVPGAVQEWCRGSRGPSRKGDEGPGGHAGVVSRVPGATQEHVAYAETGGSRMYDINMLHVYGGVGLLRVRKTKQNGGEDKNK